MVIKMNKKKAFIVSSIVGGLLIAMTLAFAIYVSIYYKSEVSLEDYDNYVISDNMTVLMTEEETDTAIIFYPGAKVEAESYLPILDSLRDEGIMCVLIEMPFNMAIFDVDAAADVFDEFPSIENWYMAGHSMGGAMASSYASDNEEMVDGLIVLGAYVYGDYPTEDALTIYGSLNSQEEHIDYTDNIVVIEGGNHAQFGNYGEQKGDEEATITAEEQQSIAVQAIVDFIN